MLFGIGSPYEIANYKIISYIMDIIDFKLVIEISSYFSS